MLGNENTTACSTQNYYTVWSSLDTNLTEYIAAITVLVVGCWILWLRPLLEKRKPHPSIPMIPDSHWLFGHLFWLLRTKSYLEKQQALVDHADQKGRCSVWMGPIPSISLTTTADAKELLWKFHTRKSVPILKYHFERLVGPKNLFVMNGREWKYNQSALRAALNRLDPFVLQSMTQETTTTLTDNLKAKIISNAGNGTFIEIPSIQFYMKMITMDVFGRSAFSHDFGCCSKLDLCAFAGAFEFMEEDIMDRCTKHTILPQNLLYWIPTGRNSNFNKQRNLARDELRDILQKRKGKENEANDIVQRILEAHTKAAGTTGNPDYAALSEDDLIDFLLSLLLAGYETLSTALTYTILLLSRHPEWEKKCLEEIQGKTTNSNENTASSEPSSNDDKFDLPICRGAIMEALRLYPVATSSSRTLEKDLVFKDGVTIPKGFHAGVSFWLIHRCEKNFPKPLEFHPDRWIPNQDSASAAATTTYTACSYHSRRDTNDKIPAGDLDAFFAFSGGARSCPGQNYALREATVALAWVIKDLKFSIDPSFELEIEWKAVVQGPKGGIPARVSIRGT